MTDVTASLSLTRPVVGLGGAVTLPTNAIQIRLVSGGSTGRTTTTTGESTLTKTAVALTSVFGSLSKACRDIGVQLGGAETDRQDALVSLKGLRDALADGNDLDKRNKALHKLFDETGLTSIAPLLRRLAAAPLSIKMTQICRVSVNCAGHASGDSCKVTRAKACRTLSIQIMRDVKSRRELLPTLKSLRDTLLTSNHLNRNYLAQQSRQDSTSKKTPITLDPIAKLRDATIKYIINSRQALLKKANDSITALGEAIGKTLLPIIDKLVPIFISLTDALTRLIQDVPLVGEVIRIAAVVLGGALVVRKLREGLGFLKRDKKKPEEDLLGTRPPVSVYVVGGYLNCCCPGDGISLDRDFPDREGPEDRSKNKNKNKNKTKPNSRPPGKRPKFGGLKSILGKIMRVLGRVKILRVIGRVGESLGKMVKGLSLSKAAKGLGDIGQVALRKAASFLGHIVSKMGGLIQIIGRHGPALITVLTSLPDLINAVASGDSVQIGSSLGRMGGSLAGGYIGGALGTLVAPGPGTIIGTIIGSELGSLGGEWLGSWVGGLFAKTEETAKGDQAFTSDQSKTVVNNNTFNISPSSQDDTDTMSRKLARHISEQTRGALYDVA